MSKSPSPASRHPRVPTMLTAGLFACAVALAASPADATLEIELQSDGATYMQSSSSPLTVSHPIGDFLVAAQIGTATGVPALDLTSADVSGAAGGTLVITLSENGLTSPVGLTNWLSQFSGNFPFGSPDVQLKTYISDSDALLGTGTLLGTIADPGSTPFALKDTGRAMADGPFALTEVLTITASGSSSEKLSGSITAGSGGTAVPEPASLSIFGAGLLAVALLSRRRRGF